MINACLKLSPIFGLSRRVHCPVCGWRGWAFESFATMTYYRSHARCPACGALSRYRALAKFLAERQLIRPGYRCLDIAPIEAIGKFLRQRQVNYFSIDLGVLPAHAKVDVQWLSFPDAIFDLIICFHVLEFVTDWCRALSEFRRVLDPNGAIVLSENYLFGQSRTVEFDSKKLFSGSPRRRFGDDLPEAMREIGFEVEAIDYLGYNDMRGDYFFLCKCD